MSKYENIEQATTTSVSNIEIGQAGISYAKPGVSLIKIEQAGISYAKPGISLDEAVIGADIARSTFVKWMPMLELINPELHKQCIEKYVLKRASLPKPVTNEQLLLAALHYILDPKMTIDQAGNISGISGTSLQRRIKKLEEAYPNIYNMFRETTAKKASNKKEEVDPRITSLTTEDMKDTLQYSTSDKQCIKRLQSVTKEHLPGFIYSQFSRIVRRSAVLYVRGIYIETLTSIIGVSETRIEKYVNDFKTMYPRHMEELMKGPTDSLIFPSEEELAASLIAKQDLKVTARLLAERGVETRAGRKVRGLGSNTQLPSRIGCHGGIWPS